ncbi:MAG TPA: GAF and ANTAR domain-containing protein [Pedococcus sp.]|nr:GAF and ANTAR domain-containing protein [Pedococcus sp.]
MDGSGRVTLPKALDEAWRLLDDFTDAARSLAYLKDTEEVADALCQLTLRIVGGDHVSITSVRDGKAATVAATSPVPELADKIQYATAQGPCLDAIRRDGTFRVEDLSTDPRWPDFGAQAVAELGVRSMLAHVLPVDAQVVGALNVYAMTPNAFRPEHENLIAILAGTAVHAIGAARHQEQIEHLERALHTSRHIGVALGVLVNARRISLDDAWDVLRKVSQDKNVKVSVLAERIISTGNLDHGW